MYPVNGTWSGTLASQGSGYLPGDKFPKNPWSNILQSTASPVATQIVTAVGGNATMGRPMDAATPNQQVGPVGATTAAAGSVPLAAGNYGAGPNVFYGDVHYDVNANSGKFVLYGIGKKNNASVIGAAVSNYGN